MGILTSSLRDSDARSSLRTARIVYCLRTPGRRLHSFLIQTQRTCPEVCVLQLECLPKAGGPPTSHTPAVTKHLTPENRDQSPDPPVALPEPFSSRRHSRNSDGSRHCHGNWAFLNLWDTRSREEAVQKSASG